MNVLFRKRLVLSLLLFSCLAVISCGTDHVEEKRPYRPIIESQPCLAESDPESMVDLFAGAYFPPKKNGTYVATTDLWHNEFAAIRAPGLLEAIGLEQWAWTKADLHSLNVRILKQALAIKPESLDKTKWLRVVYVPSNQLESARADKIYREGDQAHRQKVDEFISSQPVCLSWTDEWKTSGEIFDQTNVFVLAEMNAQHQIVNRAEIGQCFVSVALTTLGFKNLEVAPPLASKPGSGVVVPTEVADWLIQLRLLTATNRFDQLTREELEKNLLSMLTKECKE